MLVLGRTKGQKILINGGAECGGLTICLVDIRGSTVKIGIQAGQEFSILRQELVIDATTYPQPVSQEASPFVDRGKAG